MFGVQVFYLPKTTVALDFLYGEDPLAKFETKYELTLYVENTGGWEGAGEMYAKFGIEFNDEGVFKIQKDRFKLITGMERPMIGDLLFLPWQKEHALMEITFADPESLFYQLGEWSIWKIKAKRFQYSHEPITALDNDETGVDNNLDIILDTNDNLDDAPEIDSEVEEDEVIDETEESPFG